ncbi:MAG: alpha/beta hydrolase [Chitinophagaceae bacterium]|nr:alpha/beta hydrolase [Chitinophagaceae bacterium]
MKRLVVYAVFFLVAVNGTAQTVQEITLYPAEIPGSIKTEMKEKIILLKGTRRVYNVTQPTLTKYESAKPNGMSIIICPGGSYMRLSVDNEGGQVAKALNEKGITAFVLKYRLPNDTSMENKSLAPLQDVQQAIRVVRKNASAWNLHSDKIGVMGFSAGGHLASMAAVHFKFRADEKEKDTTSIHPDFVMLIYPVINFSGKLLHKESRDNLLGTEPTRQQISFFSTDLRVTPACPPVFLVHAEDDASVPVENSLRFYEACVKNKVPAAMHLYPRGGHGFGLENSTTKDKWMDRLFNWLDELFKP